MKLKHDRDSAWKDAAPHRAAFKAGVLIDDMIHKGVSRASEELQGRGLDKKKQAYLASSAGLFVGAVLCQKEPDLGKSMIINMQNCIEFIASVAVFEKLARTSFRAGGEAAADSHDLLAKIVRLPMLIASAVALVYGYLSENASIPLDTGFVWGAYALSLYILSSSTGMIDRLRERLAGLLDGGEAASPVPVKIKD